MDFAADAVLDVIAPPARPAPARAPSADAGESSFAEQLQALAREDALTEQSMEQGAGTEAATNFKPSESLGADVAPAPQTLERPTSPVFVQLMAAGAPTTPQPAAQTPPTAQAPGPNNAPSAEPPGPAMAAPAHVAPRPADSAAAMPTEADATPAPPPHAQKNATTPAEKSSAPTAPALAPAASAAPSAAQTTATPASTPTASQTTATPASLPTASPAVARAPSAALPESPTATIAAAQPQAGSAPDARRARAPSHNESESGAPPVPQRPAAPSSATVPKLNAKPATPHRGAQEAIAVTPLDTSDASPTPQLMSTGPASAASAQAQHAAIEHAARALPAAQQVAREIVRRFEGGSTRFELRLDPPELGRVDVRLDVSRDHRVSAVIAADSPQALTELARHARELEQMLQGAGLELSDNGLSFDLRQSRERADAEEINGVRGALSAEPEEAPPVAARPLGYERWRGVRVDMMV